MINLLLLLYGVIGVYLVGMFYYVSYTTMPDKSDGYKFLLSILFGLFWLPITVYISCNR